MKAGKQTTLGARATVSGVGVHSGLPVTLTLHPAEAGTGIVFVRLDAEGRPEREIRAQVEHAIAVGIHPTHLDSHMGALFSRPDLFAVYVKVAHEYKLPFLAFIAANMPPGVSSAISEKDVLINSVIIANPMVQTANWKTFYLDAIKNLKPGVTEIIVHLGHDDAELQAVMVDHADYGAAWRQRDYDVLTSPEFKQALEDNHIILVKWRDIKKLLSD